MSHTIANNRLHLIAEFRVIHSPADVALIAWGNQVEQKISMVRCQLVQHLAFWERLVVHRVSLRAFELV